MGQLYKTHRYFLGSLSPVKINSKKPKDIKGNAKIKIVSVALVTIRLLG